MFLPPIYDFLFLLRGTDLIPPDERILDTTLFVRRDDDFRNSSLRYTDKS